MREKARPQSGRMAEHLGMDTNEITTASAIAVFIWAASAIFIKIRNPCQIDCRNAHAFLS